MRFKDRVRELRKSKNLTLKDLSNMTGLSVSYISDIERGKADPSLNTIEVLSEAFEISIQALLTDVEFSETTHIDSLPDGLQALIDDEEFKDEINEDWIELLSKIQMRGKRPQTKREWMELYLHLSSLLGG